MTKAEELANAFCGSCQSSKQCRTPCSKVLIPLFAETSKSIPDYVYDLSKLPEFIKVNEAALILRCSESKIRQAYNNGDLDIFHYGKLVLIPRESFLRFKDKFMCKRAS